jgi:ABC-type multidrug transport system ATPase subunit
MLEIKEVTKLFTPTTGIKDISITISHGQIVAFVGPNGAGKSTLFNILGRVMQADSGSCIMDGVEYNALHISEIGFLPETLYLLENITPYKMIRFLNTMRETRASDTDIDELICRFGVDVSAQKKIKKLSQGMRKRVELVSAFIGSPKLLVLDEPLNSLDIHGVLAFKDILNLCKERGHIVLLSSHILDFLDSAVDSVVFLKDGKIVEVCSEITGRVEDIYRKHFEIIKSPV